ncbi:amidohydrolase family protein [Adlercreutzia sp. ZJ154]|uniref:amidohydrolase family protein n=1 Tax=Adlercreutzia sp. ZJ154 TaxID=2709790 RepID=UPI0013EC781F|nr:amidohydrolase family protein [Adlercreutzia sp. ZJ154]
MPVIDCHCHIYPAKIADRAVEGVGNFYNIHMDACGGTSQALIADSAPAPITHHVVHSVATRPEQVRSINDFIAQECAANPHLIGFMTLHQDMEDPLTEIERACAMGLVGVKLHPDTQRVNMDDARLMRIYEAIEGRLPLIMHCGDYRYDFSHPRRMRKILDTFPNLVVNAAHFGGWSIFDVAVEYMEDARCFMDVSSSMKFLGNRRTTELIQLYGTDRIMFGSDFPMWNPADEYQRFTSLPFSPAEFENMTWHNAEKFLGRSISD